jgi:hypothetical protein
MATRFDFRNVAGQCKKENRFEGGNPYEFGLAIDERFGKGPAAKLFKLSKTTTLIGELSQRISAAKHSYLAYITLCDELASRTLR